MALGRNHIASTPIAAIAMLCFNYTVGLPWSVPVLSRLLSVSRREPPEDGRKPLHSTARLQASSGQAPEPPSREGQQSEQLTSSNRSPNGFVQQPG